MERYGISDLIQIALRRFFWVFIPFTALVIVGLVALNEVPARYHSRALLIVADQQVSEDLVPSAIQAIAQDRLEAIKAQVRARDNVISLAQRFDLFDPSSTLPFSEQVMNVRNDIQISIEKVANRRRRDEAGTITFEIGFIHENPRTAFRVANQLVTDFLAENVETRIEQAEGTASFFRDEARTLQRDITDVRSQIRQVRDANPGVTPDSAEYNRALVQRLSFEIERTEERIEETNQDLTLLRMQQPLIIDANERADLERITLRDKRRTLAALESQYTSSYPAVIRLTSEVLELEARLDPAAFRERANNLLDRLNEQIADREGLSQRELADLRERRDNLEKQIAEARRSGGETSLARLQFETNEQALIQRIETSEARLQELRQELSDVEAKLSRMPEIAARLEVLEGEEQRLLALLDRTQISLAQAERSENLEAQQKAERVEILESPVLPDVPTSPDKPRLALMLTAAAGGIAAAFGLAPVFLFPRVDTGRQLGHALPGVTVVEVPEIVDEEEQKFRRIVLAGLIIASLLLTAAAAFVAYKVLL